MKLETIGVIGAGVMGAGVAQNLAQTGHRAIVLDLDESILQNAERAIRDGLRLFRLMRKGALLEDNAAILARLAFSTDPARLRDVDLVIENVPERWDAKEQALRQADEICRPEALLASNTSAMPISRLASFTARPTRVIGTHFMNPAPLKNAVEVVCGEKTAQQTLDAVLELLKNMGKKAVVVGDSPGFVTNRVLMSTINEAVRLVEEDVADAETVDHVFTSCFGHPMGPLATADLIGLDTIVDTLEVLRDSFPGPQFRPAPLLVRMVREGRLGRKTGRGFFDYGL